ncbi:MAG: transglycosylase SLT domain-containing protein, partial [Longimicrobiales bacterium]
PSAWALRGRAADELDRPDEAVESYRAALEDPRGLPEATSTILRIRLARTLAMTGTGLRDSALLLVEDLTATAPWATTWLGLDLARSWSEAGDVERTTRALELVTDEEARGEGWDLVARAHLEAGDTTAALDSYLESARGGGESLRRAEAWSRVGRIRLALEAREPARRALRNALEEGPVREEVAEILLDLGLETADEAFRVYRVLRRSGDEEDALEALDRYAELRRTAEDPGDEEQVLSAELRLERAGLLAEADRLTEASRELEGLTSLDEMEVAAPALDLLASVRRRQGLHGEYRTFQDLLVRRFPSHPDAVDVVFFRADDLHDRQEWSGALSYYGRAVEMAPESNRAGLARMRMGQIHLTRGSLSEAAEVYEGYVQAFPRGRRWDEARYWAAWSRLGLGQAEEAREHLTAILDGDPLSYYAILGLRLLEQSFAPAVPEGSPPPSVPEIDDALDRVEVLRESGLEEGVEPSIEALRERYDASQDTLLRLSLELSERGFSMDGISVGWEVQGRGRAWDRWLMRAVYPFPYRDLVRLEAEEWGLDPFYLAALIRQESAFLAEARSGAGAMGLMQVIPSTGESMARSVGPEGFAEHHLLHPEVNLHLGAAFLARLGGRFGDRTPLVLAAYNAGPTRASRWDRDFPEARELERFTERIPYEETRGYVKRVTRNVELYRWLYGSAE